MALEIVLVGLVEFVLGNKGRVIEVAEMAVGPYRPIKLDLIEFLLQFFLFLSLYLFFHSNYIIN